MTRLKVCGMKYRPNIEEILGHEPDYLGFIFYEKSPRNVDQSLNPEFVRFIRSAKKVGVFVNAEVKFMQEKIHTYGLDLVQLHGKESPEVCLQMKAEGVGVIKVFSVGNDFDFSTLAPYKEVVDYFLFDTKGKQPGGNGIIFNWDILADYHLDIPFFLSGGISLEETDRLRQFSHPQLFALDINSKFEIRPGEKDPVAVGKMKSELTK